MQEENAAAFHIEPGAGFHATIEVEPLHITDGNGALDATENQSEDENKDLGGEASDQVCTRKMSWDRTKGFVFAEDPICKTSSARSIAISDDGQISTKPMPTASDQ